jgi:hypothetical protein
VSSARSAPRLYNEDLTQLEWELGRRRFRRNRKKGIVLCQESTCDLKLQWDSVKPVARIRLVKTENPGACATANWRVYRIAIVLYYVWSRAVWMYNMQYIQSSNPKPALIVTHTRDKLGTALFLPSNSQEGGSSLRKTHITSGLEECSPRFKTERS